MSAEVWPTTACDKVISRADFPEKALNLAADGGYILWKAPGRKVFVDPRVTVYGASFYQGLARALLGQAETWDNLLKKWEPGAIILNCSWPGAGAALRRLTDDKEQWALVYFDGISAILARRTTEAKALISDLEVQVAGLRELQASHQKFRNCSRSIVKVPANPTRLIGAGSVYLALWRFREAVAVYTDVVRLSPDYATGWLNLGISSFQRGHLDQAYQALTQAGELRPDSALAWLWLSKVHEAKGEKNPAERALQKARQINKAMADAFEQGFHSNTNQPVPGSLNATNR